jgi:hypothetical protein
MHVGVVRTRLEIEGVLLQVDAVVAAGGVAGTLSRTTSAVSLLEARSNRALPRSRSPLGENDKVKTVEPIRPRSTSKATMLSLKRAFETWYCSYSCGPMLPASTLVLNSRITSRPSYLTVWSTFRNSYAPDHCPVTSAAVAMSGSNSRPRECDISSTFCTPSAGCG